jgi:hypothetical protein
VQGNSKINLDFLWIALIVPSPLPGMNSFLETPELWSEFHSRMIVAIADALDETLSQGYRVAVEQRVYLDQGEVTLTLQPLLHRVYDRARFGLAIDYGQPLTPQLSETDAAWRAGLVQPDPPALAPP